MIQRKNRRNLGGKKNLKEKKKHKFDDWDELHKAMEEVLENVHHYVPNQFQFQFHTSTVIHPHGKQKVIP